MGHPFAPATYHNPKDSSTLRLFAPFQPIHPGHVIPVVVGCDTYNLMWILLSPPDKGLPIQPGTIIQAYEPEDLKGSAVFTATAAGPIDCDRRYIIFALFDVEDVNKRHPYDLAVPHSWSWISEEDQSNFATYRHERDDDFFPRVTAYLETLFAQGLYVDDEGREVVLDPFPFNKPLQLHTDGVRRTRSLPDLRDGEIREVAGGNDWAITSG